MKEKPIVALVKGESRTKNIQRALKLIEDKIKAEIKKRVLKRGYILIKPNFVSTRRQLAATHVQAVETLLQFLREFYKGKIIIGEGASVGSTFEGYKNYGYFPLERKYKVKLVDLNFDQGVDVFGLNADLKPMRLKIAKTLAKAPYKISITPMKTHDTAIVTLSIKNMAVGGLLKGGFRPFNLATRLLFKRPYQDYKSAIHQGPKAINKTIAKLYEKTKPDLAVIDGFVGMERNGPVGGEPVEMKVALASSDALAADTVGTYLMGFEPESIGYLYHLKADLKNVKVIGAKVKNCRKKFRPHDTYLEQARWKK